jgi:hypothetical protein
MEAGCVSAILRDWQHSVGTLSQKSALGTCQKLKVASRCRNRPF